jgi:hypothetical protein
MNKNSIRAVCAAAIVLFAAVSLPAQPVSLNDAIKNSSKAVEEALRNQTLVAILNFSSSSESLSNHVIEELMDVLTTDRRLIVVERQKLDLIRNEMAIQLSGDVSDESAQAIGKMLGAQSIISGSLSDTGDGYRFRLFAINVETAVREASVSLTVNRSDRQLAFLLSAGNRTAVDPALRPAEVSGSNTTFAIGDTGPAGGFIVYDKGSFTSGWRYIEAAPLDAEYSARAGGAGKDINGTAAVIGSGRNNTRSIIDVLSANNESNGAALLCPRYNGFNDWFIPGKDELDILYTIFKASGQGGFSNERYLTSTLDGRSDVWVQNFRDGRQLTARRSQVYRVRCIRVF